MSTIHLTRRGRRVLDLIIVFVFGLMIGIVALAFLLKATAPAYAAPDPVVNTQPAWLPPYGGCDEAWSYPESNGAAECVRHGALPECANEDRGRLCSWNIGRPGLAGDDLWYDAEGKRHYLTGRGGR